jgi:hypothetical protein
VYGSIHIPSCICTAGIRALALGIGFCPFLLKAALGPIPHRLEERRAMRRCGRRYSFSSSGYFAMLFLSLGAPLVFNMPVQAQPPSGRGPFGRLYRTPPFGSYWLSNPKMLAPMRYLL